MCRLSCCQGRCPQSVFMNTFGREKNFFRCQEIRSSHGFESDSDDEIGWNDSNSTNASEGPSFPELNEKITKAIQSLGGAAFPKLNWSCPRDASWIAFDNTLKCTSPRDVYLLLKSSDFIMHDLTEPFSHCGDTEASSQLQYHLVLRQWHSLSPAGEFRCFVKNKMLIGISQRNHTAHYPSIAEEKDAITADIRNFFTDQIQAKFPLSNYVFDVYVKERGKCCLVDFNSYGPMTNGLLFAWEDLLQEKPLNFDITENIDIKPVFRYVETGSQIQASTYECFAMPQDFLHLSTGQDPQKLIDFLQMKTQNPDDSSSEDEQVIPTRNIPTT